MELKNKEIKKLFDSMAPYFDLFSLPSVMSDFMACDAAIEGEIAAIKAELTDANRYKDIYHGSADHLRNVALDKGDKLRKAINEIESLKKMIDELKEKLNNERKHGEDLADVNCQLASENVDLKARLEALKKENSDLRTYNKALVDTCKSRFSALFEARKNAEQCKKSFMEYCEENKRLRVVIDELEKEIHELEEKTFPNVHGTVMLML